MHLHIFRTPFLNESRALKEISSALKSGLTDRVTVVALWQEGLEEYTSPMKHVEVWRVRLWTGGLPKKLWFGKLKRLEWTLRIIFWSIFLKDISLIQAHSLAALPPAVFIKFLNRKRLVYDAHELETETNGLKGYEKFLSKIVEWLCIRFADHTIVVSGRISGWYQNHYALKNIEVVKNIPEQVANAESKKDQRLRTALGISPEEIVYIYLGGLFPGRGIMQTLDVFSKVRSGRSLIFLGYGSLEGVIKEYSNRFDNIYFHAAVPPNSVVSYASGADVGIFLCENTCLSYYYSLPNKLYEYFLAGLPMITSDFPEMADFINEYRCGWTAGFENKKIVELIDQIDRKAIAEKTDNIFKNKNSIHWSSEEKKYLSVIANMADRQSA